MNKIYWLSIIAIGFAVFSCSQLDTIDDIEGISYNAEYAVPIMNSAITIQDLLQDFQDDNTLQVDPNGNLRFKYSGDVISATVEQMFEEINDALPPLIPILEPGMALPLSSPDGIMIDYMQLKSGAFTYFFESPNTEPVEVTITLPQITKDGEPLTIVKSLPAYSGEGIPPVAENQNDPLSLADYTIVPLNDSVYVDYTVTKENGESGALDAIFLTIKDLEFSYTEGFLGTLNYEGGRDTIVIDFFDNYVNGDIYFAEPTVTFNIQNSFGIPTRSLVNIFEVFTVDGERLPLESVFIDEGFDFPFPNLDEVGAIKSKEFVFTKENSNIDVILGSGPTAVDYDVDAITNPDGNEGIRGFITDSSFYNVQVEVDLPLYVNVEDFVANDTVDLDFNSIDDVVDAEFKLVSENAIPLEASIQGYFVNVEGQIIDSLFAEQTLVVAGAMVDADGNALDSNRKEVFVTFDEDHFPPIRDANQLILNVSFSSTGTESVRINRDQEITVKMGAKLGVRK